LLKKDLNLYGGKMTHTIMCIDDEQMVLDSIKCSIKNEPYQILTSTNGEDALSKLEQNQYFCYNNRYVHAENGWLRVFNKSTKGMP
jgi:DNA-binding NtrC family response regulator